MEFCMEFHLEEHMGCHVNDWMTCHMKDHMRCAHTVSDQDCR
jgi:hypothetical protein